MDLSILTRRRGLGPALLTAVALLFGCAGAPTSGPAAAGELVLVDRGGVTHDVAGTSAVLVFWQPWCGTCREEAPAVIAAARELAGKAKFFGVVSGPDDLVDDERLDETIADLGLDYPQVRDRDNALGRRFEVHSTPTVIVLGPSGRLRYRGSHLPSDWSVVR